MVLRVVRFLLLVPGRRNLVDFFLIRILTSRRALEQSTMSVTVIRVTFERRTDVVDGIHQFSRSTSPPSPTLPDLVRPKRRLGGRGSLARIPHHTTQYSRSTQPNRPSTLSTKFLFRRVPNTGCQAAVDPWRS